MSDVTDIDDFRPKRPEMVFECSGCSGQHFYLHNDGTVECRSCKRIVEHIEWTYRSQKAR